MAHAHANTLLQKMGFKDPDHELPAHDTACVSLVMNAQKLLALVPRWGVRDIAIELEKPLQKGDGKYASTVGFIDAMIKWDEWSPRDACDSERRMKVERWRCPACGMAASTREREERCKTCKGPQGHAVWLQRDDESLVREGPAHPLVSRCSMLVEVKTKISGIGDLLRQMNLYREYQPADEYTVWSLTESDAVYEEVLLSQRINLVVGSSLDLLVATRWIADDRD